MKHILTLSIILMSSSAFAQRWQYGSWQQLENGTYSHYANPYYQQQQNIQVRDTTAQELETYYDTYLEDFWPRHKPEAWENSDNQNGTETAQRAYYSSSTIKICKTGEFMKIITPQTVQMFNYTLKGRNPVVNVNGTQIQIHVDSEGNWKAVDENNSHLFEEVECN